MMNHMRTIGSRKICDTNDSDAYAPQRSAVDINVRASSDQGAGLMRVRNDRAPPTSRKVSGMKTNLKMMLAVLALSGT